LVKESIANFHWTFLNAPSLSKKMGRTREEKRVSENEPCGKKTGDGGCDQVMYRIALSLGLELRSPTSNENTEIPRLAASLQKNDDDPLMISNQEGSRDGVCLRMPGQGVKGGLANRQVFL
jgi:hypothetical protein